MTLLCTLASVSASTSLRTRSMACRLLLKFPPTSCQAVAKCHGLQAARMSSLSQTCHLLQFPGLLLRCSPLNLQKSFLHSQPFYQAIGLHRATRYTLLRVRCAAWMDTVGSRMASGSGREAANFRARTGMIYVFATVIFMLGMSYAGVPLYRMFCQATGLGGTVSQGHDTSKIETMQAVQERVITVRFNADVASSMMWNFKPQQIEVKVLPGETALAFYTAKNPMDKPIIGISTYNVVPYEAGQYFNKIQCFCFEEQRLNPHEQVDMPVFFYIDPEFAEDPKLRGVDTITLSYTFFEAKEGFQVPLPGYMTQAQ